MEKEKPRTGGKQGDRLKVERRRDHNKGGKAGFSRGNQPKYDDTEEARKQKQLIREIETKINKVTDQLKRIDKVKVVRSTKPRVHIQDKGTLEKKIEELNKKISEKDKEIKELEPKLKLLKDVYLRKKAEVTKLRSTVFYVNAAKNDFMERNNEKVQEQVKRLERRLETESLSIPEEKQIVKDIKKVKAMKNNFSLYQKVFKDARSAERAFNNEEKEFSRKKDAVAAWEESVSNYQQDLEEIAKKEKEAKQQVEQVKKEVETKKQQEKDEKQKLVDELDELAVQLRKEKDNLRVYRDNWYDARRKARDQEIREKNKERDEKRKEQEKAEKEKLAEKRQERKQQIPFEYEIASCQSLIKYLNELLAKTTENKSEEKKEESSGTEEKKTEEVQGYIKGRDEPENLLFPDSKSKSNKKKKKKKKKPAKITHNWDTFARFEELGLSDPPVTPSQLPKAVEQVKAKLAELQKLSKEKRAEILKEIAKEEEEEKKEKEAQKKKLEENKKEEAEKKEEAKEEKKEEEPKKEENSSSDNKNEK